MDDPGRPGPVAKLRLAVEVTRTYRTARRAMAGGDLSAALEQLRAPQVEDRPPVAGHVEGVRLGRAVARTLGALPADSRCLMQSLVLTGMLARRGTPSKLVIGVRPGEAFGAHAWVEMDGRPLLPPMAEDFVRLVDL